MSGPSLVEYHRARAVTELELAAMAHNGRAAAAHRALAHLHLLSAGDGEDLPQTGSSLAPAAFANVA